MPDANVTVCRERIQKLKAELEEQVVQAEEESALRLAGLEGEAQQMAAAARHEGEARCATVQVALQQLYADFSSASELCLP